MAVGPSLSDAERWLLWLTANALWAAIVAWAAFQAQQEGMAPAILFPLAVGALWGAGGVTIFHYTGGPPLAIASGAVLVGGLLVVIGQDYIGYRHHLRGYDEQVERSPLSQIALTDATELRPAFPRYLVSVIRRRPAWWLLDVLLTTGGNLLVMASMICRRPQTIPQK